MSATLAFCKIEKVGGVGYLVGGSGCNRYNCNYSGKEEQG